MKLGAPLVCLTLLLGMAAPAAAGEQIAGEYLEMRTCDIYTGPCFANAEVGLTGRQAVLAWSIEEGSFQGVDLSGLKVVLAINATNTLAEGGGMKVKHGPVKAVVLTDAQADAAQQKALVEFVKSRNPDLTADIQRVDSADIAMHLDHLDMAASLRAGKAIQVKTRKLVAGDCVCTNEEIYYPPLSKVENAAPAYALEGKFAGSGLGVTWSHPRSRSAYLGTFAYDVQ